MNYCPIIKYKIKRLSSKVNSMNNERKRTTPIHFLELPRTTIKTIKLLHLVSSDFSWAFLSINFLQLGLRVIKSVYCLDNFSGILLEQKHKKFILASLQCLYQTFSFFSIEFTGKTHICDSVYHQFFIRLPGKRILSLFRLYLRFRYFIG